MSILDTARNALSLILTSPAHTPAASPIRPDPPSTTSLPYSHIMSSTSSFAHSNASLNTSRTPLGSRPGASVDLSSEHDPMPPTTNELDATERARLLRKTRKLSRMLGELPIPVPQSPIEELDVSSSTPSSANSMKLARKFSTHMTPPPMLVDVPKRLITRMRTRPTIPAVSPSRSPRPSPTSTSSHDRHEPQLAHLTAPPPVPPKDDFNDEDDASSDEEQLVPTAEQRQRARLAKLSRFLGETVPAELIRQQSLAPAPREAEAALRKLGSLAQQRAQPRRRVSVDISNLVARGQSPPPAEAPKSVRRSKSLWNIVKPSLSKTPSEAAVATIDWPASSSHAPPIVSRAASTSEPLPSRLPDVLDKERAARARKVAQSFVRDASSEAKSSKPAEGLRVAAMTKRASIASFVSVEDGLLAPRASKNSVKRSSLQSHASWDGKRASIITFISADDVLVDSKRGSLQASITSHKGSDEHRASIITFFSTVSGDPADKNMRRHSSFAIDLAAEEPVPPPAPGHARRASVLLGDERPPSPRPFEDIAATALPALDTSADTLERNSFQRSVSAPSPAAADEPSPLVASAWAHRRRAAKLSRFFGVEYEAMDPAAVSLPPSPSTQATFDVMGRGSVEVRRDVQVSVPARRWGVIPAWVREREPEGLEVINQLRMLRAG